MNKIYAYGELAGFMKKIRYSIIRYGLIKEDDVEKIDAIVSKFEELDNQMCSAGVKITPTDEIVNEICGRFINAINACNSYSACN